MSQPGEVTPARHSRWKVLADIYHERTNFQFIARSWQWLLLSGSLVAISLLALGVRGLNLGIDFEGGTQWQFTMGSGSVSAGEVRDVVRAAGVNDPKILILGNNGVRVQSEELRSAEREKVTVALAAFAHIDQKEVSVTDVGPTWGENVSQKALIALGVFFALISVYLTARFELKMAFAAIVAVIHDIAITVGVYALTQFEVTPATVVAVLTILGFSMYDTVVVFDKVRENQSALGTERADTYSRMVNRSLNQVLMRSLNTSFVAVLPVLSLLVVGGYVLGAVSLRDFALALTVGLLSGAYSSIFVATPVLAWLKEREPRHRALRERSEVQLAKDAERLVAPLSVGVTRAVAGRVGDGAPAAPAAGLQVAQAPPNGPRGEPTASVPPRRTPSGRSAPRPRRPRRKKRR